MNIHPNNFWLVFGGIWLALGVPFLGGGIYTAYEHLTLNERFEKQAQTARGMVLAKEVRASKKSGEITYLVTFRFTRADEETMRSDATVTKAAWNALDERGPIEVRYFPDWPYRHRITGQSAEDKFWLALLFLALGGIITSGGGFAVAWSMRRRREVARLRKVGLLAKATVTGIGPANIRINKEQQITVRYSYRDVGGTEHHGDVTLSPEEARPWSPGKTGNVRYDRVRPGVHAWLGESTQ